MQCISLACSTAALSVLCMRQATVHGPTPPGTGVTTLAT